MFRNRSIGFLPLVVAASYTSPAAAGGDVEHGVVVSVFKCSPAPEKVTLNAIGQVNCIFRSLSVHWMYCSVRDARLERVLAATLAHEGIYMLSPAGLRARTHEHYALMKQGLQGEELRTGCLLSRPVPKSLVENLRCEFARAAGAPRLHIGMLKRGDGNEP